MTIDTAALDSRPMTAHAAGVVMGITTARMWDTARLLIGGVDGMTPEENELACAMAHRAARAVSDVYETISELPRRSWIA